MSIFPAIVPWLVPIYHRNKGTGQLNPVGWLHNKTEHLPEVADVENRHFLNYTESNVRSNRSIFPQDMQENQDILCSLNTVLV